MPAPAATPPPLRAPVRRWVDDAALPVYAAGVGVVLATVVARAMVDGRIFHPGCGFKWITGHPCVACGGTRSLAALGDLRAAEAFSLNPLVAALAVLMLAVVPLVIADERLNHARVRSAVLAAVRGHRWLRWGAAALVALNWAYLLRALD